MRGKLGLPLFIVLALLIGLISACSTTEPTPIAASATAAPGSPSGPAAEVPVLVFAGVPSDPRISSFEKIFVDLVNVRGKGKVSIEHHPLGELGTETQMLDDIKAGAVDIYISDHGAMTGIVPWGTVLADLPFAWTSPVAYTRWCRNIVAPKWNEALASQNMMVLDDTAFGGASSFFSRVGQIRTPADLEGKMFRAMSPGIETNWITALGSKATVVPWSELYTSFEQGTIDLQHNPAMYMITSSFYEVIHDVTVTNHKMWGYFPVLNLKKWNTLPKESQQLLQDCWAITAATWSWDSLDVDEDYLEEMQQAPYNVRVYRPTDAELQEFKTAVMPAYDSARKEFGDELVDMVLDYSK